MLVGLPHRPFWAGERRARPRPAGAALERGDQGRLLAADEGAGALDQLDVEVEAAAQDVLAEDAVVPGLRERPLSRWTASGYSART